MADNNVRSKIYAFIIENWTRLRGTSETSDIFLPVINPAKWGGLQQEGHSAAEAEPSCQSEA